MNKPFTVAPVPTAGRPLTAVGTNPIGAGPRRQSLANPTGEAGAPSLSTYTYEHVGLDDYVSRVCPDCDGVGEVEILAIDATYPVIVDCDPCGGTGEVAVYCQCGAPVTGGAPDGDGGVCHDCELVFYRDDREPTDDEIYAGWETAERYALQFRDGEAAR